VRHIWNLSLNNFKTWIVSWKHVINKQVKFLKLVSAKKTALFNNFIKYAELGSQPREYQRNSKEKNQKSLRSYLFFIGRFIVKVHIKTGDVQSWSESHRVYWQVTKQQINGLFRLIRCWPFLNKIEFQTASIAITNTASGNLRLSWICVS
jgi:hypothetical protein